MKFSDENSGCDMDKKNNEYITAYKKQLSKGEIQIAYNILLKCVMRLKAHCEKTFPQGYSFGNVSPGYMDFTYFPFFNEYLRKEKLRFGIVLNHSETKFEFWLMGQNSEIQTKYWNLLKESFWNQERADMPKYSVLEVILADNPDFDDMDTLTTKVAEKAVCVSEEILNYLKTLVL